MSWTFERVEKLTSLWREGKTASQIATELTGVTRNAVIGKAHRLGLSGRPSPIKKGEAGDNTATTTTAKPRKTAAKKTATTATKAKAAPKKAATAEPKATARPTPAKKAAAAAIPAKKKAATVTRLPAPRVPRDEGAANKAFGPGMNLADLTERTCRWPIGDPRNDDFHFCGAEVEAGQSYCPHHAALAYQQPQPREDRNKNRQLKTVAPSKMVASS